MKAFKRLLFLLAVTVAPSAFGFSLGHEWERFKVKFGKTYNDEFEEETCRISIFRDNLKKIADHNRRYLMGLETYTQGVNHFTDLTFQEFSAQLGCNLENGPGAIEDLVEIINQDKEDESFEHNRSTIEDEDDQFSYPLDLIPVRNQGNCGSCWAFSVIGAVEYQYALKHKQVLNLSEQELVSCDTKNNGCRGGNMFTALLYIKRNGISSTDEFPYTAQDSECPTSLPDRASVKVTKVYQTRTNEDNIAENLKNNGPVSIGFKVDPAFQHYSGGIISSSTCSFFNLGGHAVLLLGYGQERGIDYWTIRNSWGPHLGEDGNFRMVKGQRMCFLSKWPGYVPIVA